MKLQDSVVLITGASSGIGAATARELIRRGAKVVLAARRAEALHTLADELDPIQARVLVVPTDVSQRAAIEQMVANAIQHFGRIDVLINNAGVSAGQALATTEDATLEKVLDVNLLAPARCIQAVLPTMRKQGRGVIINIGSVAGEIATPGIYSATKFGLRGLSDGLRRELGREKIAVVLVEPGFVATEMTAGFRYRMPGPEIVARAITRAIEQPRRRVIVPWWYGILSRVGKALPWLVDLAFRHPYVRKASRWER